MQRHLRNLSGTLTLILVAACGGGGSDAPANQPPSAGKTTITPANASAVASRSANAAFQAGDLSANADFIGITSAGGFGVTKALQPEFAKGSNAAAIPVGPTTTLCIVSGSITLTGDVASLNTITAGDFFDVDWDNCDDGIGLIIDGQLSLTVTDFEGDLLSGQVLLETSLEFTDLQISGDDHFNSVDGAVDSSIDTRMAPVTSLVTSGDRLTVADNDGTESLTDFMTSISHDETVLPALKATIATGTVTSTQFDGEVTYSTPVTFEALGDAYPYTGQLLITGADNATVQLTALDEVNVQIAADYDGDGVVDETIDTTWEALFNGAV